MDRYSICSYRINTVIFYLKMKSYVIQKSNVALLTERLNDLGNLQVDMYHIKRGLLIQKRMRHIVREREKRGGNKMKEIKVPIILSSLAIGTLAFLLPIYSYEMDMNAVEIGGLFSIFSMVVVLVRPLIGRVVDKRGDKGLFVLGLLAYVVAFWVLAEVGSVEGIYIGRVIQALASSLMGVSTYSIVIGQTKKNDIATNLGKITEWGTQGSLIGCMICFFIFTNRSFMEGWRKLFLIYAVGAAGAALMSLVGIKQPPQERRNKEKKRTKRTSEVVKFLGITFGLAVISSMLGPMLMIYLQEQFTNQFIILALVFMPSTIIYSTLSSKLGKFSDKYGRIRGMSIGLLISGSAILFIPSTHSLIILAALWCIDAIGGVISETAENAFCYEVMGADRLGEGYGVYRMVGGLGAVIGPLIGGIIYERISGEFVFYLEGIGLILIAGILVVLFNPRKLNGGGKCIDENICERRF